MVSLKPMTYKVTSVEVLNVLPVRSNSVKLVTQMIYINVPNVMTTTLNSMINV
jgi:hypothetical protein